MKPILTIIISTLNEGIYNCKNAVLIQDSKLCYLIIHQNLNGCIVPEFLKRDDISIITSRSKGISKSRNIGIQNCNTTYALIADDDVKYTEDGLQDILKIIKTDKPDFATFKIKTLNGEPVYKDYPIKKIDLNLEPHHNISSIEILINIIKIKFKDIKFDERFGLGAKFIKGEEEIFISDLKNTNFKGIYYPIDLVIHPYESSGKLKLKESYNYFLKGAVFTRQKKNQPCFNHFNIIRKLKNQFFYNLGKLYIKVTNE